MKKVDYVAYLRSGSNYFHQVLTLYSGVCAWHDIYIPTHDRYLKGKFNGCYYVWRNPVDVIFSLFSATYCNDRRIMCLSHLSERWLKIEINRIKRHFAFYWEHAGIVVRYRDLMEDAVWPEILNFFNLDYDEQRILDCSSKVTLAASINYWGESKWMTSFMATNEYRRGREDFKEMYEDRILDDFSRHLNKDRDYLTQKNND